jgi:chorismate mutase
MRVSREIGTYKKEHGITVLQAARYDEILKGRIALGERLGMSPNFTKAFIEAVHEESVRIQMELMNGEKKA